MGGSKISKLVVAIVSQDTAEVVERWQFDIEVFGRTASSKKSAGSPANKENSAP